MSFEQGRESLDAPATPDSTKAMPVGDMPMASPREVAGLPSDTPSGDSRARLDKVLQSNIGINTLLTRLKQSISSAKEFSIFLRERAMLEEKHAHGLKKLTRSTHELVRRPENRQGSFAQSYEEMMRIQDRMADNGSDFAQNLHIMAEELQELAATSERGRKHWKHTGLDAEQRTQDAEMAMDKAKQRYFSNAEQYDRARTGERQSGKFSLTKGTKTAAQQEEALLSKVQNLDTEYSERVQAARAQRHELISSSRPQAVRELQNCIMECDAGLGMQLQKYALLNEKLLLHNGLSVSPLKNQQTEGSSMTSRSLRELAQGVNNQRDFEDYVLSHTSHVGPTPAEIQYEKHTVMMPTNQSSYGGGQSDAAPVATASSIMGGLDRRDTRNQDRSDAGTLGRRDTNASLFNGSANQSGSTFAGPQSSATGPSGPYGPAQSTTSAPQLPQIGGLSIGGRSSLDSSSMPGSFVTSGSEPDRRDVSGPQQHRPGQQSYSGPMSTPSYNAGPIPQRDPYGSGGGLGGGMGRGQPQAGSSAYTIGHSHTLSTQSPYSMGGRSPSYGQSNDFRSDGPGLSTGSSYKPPFIEGRHNPSQSSYQPQSSEGRGAPSPMSYQTQQSEGRGMPFSANYSSQQQDGRGLPSQNGGYHVPGNNFSPSNTTTPMSGSSYGPSSNVAGGASNTYGPPNNVGSMSSMLGNRGASNHNNLPPLKPVFGVSLDDLFRRDGGAVPPIVYQCVQAVDLYGLNTEGIYRTSGSAHHITDLRMQFDHDSSLVDFRDPTAFHNDIAAVTTLLKHFLRDLKDPLLTSAQYNAFIQAAKIDDDIIRRDSLHAIINSLPDPNYATLRTLTLHLNRVAQHSAQNRMTTNNLAIVFGPTLMVGQAGVGAGAANEEFGDSGYQARVVETILENTYQIFDDDDD